MLRSILFCLLTAAALFGAMATTAQVPFPNYPEPDLPEMEPCVNKKPVPLPEKWEAVTLMSPYLYHGNFPDGANLRVGRFVYDDSVGAMRAQLNQVGPAPHTSGVLITRGATWVLSGDWENPTCVGRFRSYYTLPGRVWQSSDAVCAGNHRTAPTIHTGPKVDWWKQPSPIKERGAEGQAGDWFWFDERGYPTRTFFWGLHAGLPAVISDYAFTNFYSFEPVRSTNLQALVDMCERAGDLPVLDEDWRIDFERTEQDHPEGSSASISDLIPGLSYEACSGGDIQPPHWPEDIYMTSFSTAAKFKTPRPISTSVYYDPAGPNLRTRLHKIAVDDNKRPFREFSDAVLLDTNSYGVNFLARPPYSQLGNPPYSNLGCAQGPHTSIPGAPHPDWGKRGRCTCMGVLENNPVLSPNRRTQIIACPLADYSGDTLFWMWYTIEEPPEPIVFLQTRADITIGTGLCLADYYRWSVLHQIPNEIFTAPQGCAFPPASAPTPPRACLYCHNPSTNTGHGTSTFAF